MKRNKAARADGPVLTTHKVYVRRIAVTHSHSAQYNFLAPEVLRELEGQDPSDGLISASAYFWFESHLRCQLATQVATGYGIKVSSWKRQSSRAAC